VRLLKETDFSEFRYEKGEVRIVVRRGDVTDTYPSEPGPRRAAPSFSQLPQAVQQQVQLKLLSRQMTSPRASG